MVIETLSGWDYRYPSCISTKQATPIFDEYSSHMAGRGETHAPIQGAVSFAGAFICARGRDRSIPFGIYPVTVFTDNLRRE